MSDRSAASSRNGGGNSPPPRLPYEDFHYRGSPSAISGKEKVYQEHFDDNTNLPRNDLATAVRVVRRSTRCRRCTSNNTQCDGKLGGCSACGNQNPCDYEFDLKDQETWCTRCEEFPEGDECNRNFFRCQTCPNTPGDFCVPSYAALPGEEVLFVPSTGVYAANPSRVRESGNHDHQVFIQRGTPGKKINR